MEAIVLAGGLGTRLRSVISEIPKPMAPVINKPYLVYLIRYLKYYGVNHIVLSVGYLSEVIEEYFKKEYLGIKISYSKEKKPLGTGGGIKLALEKCKKKNVVILNGDSFFDVNINELKEFHKKTKATVSLAIRKVDNVGRYGEVILNSDENLLDELEELNNEEYNSSEKLESIVDNSYTFVPTKKYKNNTYLRINFKISNKIKTIDTYVNLKLSKVLVNSTRDIKFDDVPQWFIDFIPINLQEQQSSINDGWKTKAIIYVKANPGVAYLKLYNQVKDELTEFLKTLDK